ncbi:MAG: hypothetical protein A2W19_12295 [Spirochaetes bacterium RBG_16_49_21]|nr:MAG: hypothetical protein A2W19_12295 [Spirochaetes bacterium RBG_16_49_21]
MKKLILSLIILTLALSYCQTRLTTIPTGTWKYKLLVNGAAIGTATISNAVAGNNYVSTLDMEIDAGHIKNSTRQIVTETRDFKPVRLEVYNRMAQNGRVNEIKTIAAFKGSAVELDTGDSKSTITIDKPFMLEGNYFMQELIKAEFKEGTVIKGYVYEPSVDIETPVLILVKVIGREEVSIGGKMMNLLHLGYSIENLKNIDAYIDDRGITQKTVIVMLNNKLELILE